MEETAHRYQLSKSTIAMFEQCPKRLWLSVRRPELAEEDESYEERFATGHAVGAIAVRSFQPHDL
jgi:CRISPR/Cas system-associated exonuclease Cas4 (RecB family)